MRTSLLAAAVLACTCLVSPGCRQSYIWWDYRDDPYLVSMAGKGEQEILRHLASAYHDERQVALRLLAHQAARERRLGRPVEANRLEDIIIRHYRVETDNEVRACIVKICAPAAGRGSANMVAFLRARIAAGEFPGYAAVSLAYLGPRGAFENIEPLTRHPAHEVRLQAATALIVLGDPRGFDPVARIWRGMHPPSWPDKINGMPLPDAREGLSRRAERAFGRPLR